MKYAEFESFQHIEKQIEGLALLQKAASIAPCLFGGSAKVKSLKTDIAGLRRQLAELKQIPDDFNRYFSPHGWIAYDLLSLDFMKSQVELMKKDCEEEAIQNFYKHYSAEQIEREIQYLHGTEYARKRIPLIELAFADYKEGRFHAVVPVLLMMIDGIVNDVAGKGFHSDGQDLDAWESLTTIDNGLDVISQTFKKGRRTTRVDEIKEPYRNGILHGLDLGYANIHVSIKCWHYLFVIRDCARSKATEKDRRGKFESDRTGLDLRTLLSKLKQSGKVKEEIEKWKPVEYSQAYVEKINHNPGEIRGDQSEFVVFKFFELLKKRNYKDLSDLFWDKSYGSKETRINRVRNQYKNTVYKSFSITKISHDAPAIHEIYSDTDKGALKFRLIYQSTNEEIAIPSLDNGQWKIVWIHELE